MTETAIVAVQASAGVREVWTLMRVKVRASITLLAVTQHTEGLAVGGCCVHFDMRESTVIIRATAFLEMLTGRCVMSRGLVGEWTCGTLGAFAFEEIALADCLLLWIVESTASMATTYSYVVVSFHSECQDGDFSVSLQLPVDVKAGQSVLGSVCCLAP